MKRAFGPSEVSHTVNHISTSHRGVKWCCYKICDILHFTSKANGHTKLHVGTRWVFPYIWRAFVSRESQRVCDHWSTSDPGTSFVTASSNLTASDIFFAKLALTALNSSKSAYLSFVHDKDNFFTSFDFAADVTGNERFACTILNKVFAVWHMFGESVWHKFRLFCPSSKWNHSILEVEKQPWNDARLAC